MFHCLCRSNANSLAGQYNPDDPDPWNRVYRALDHREALKKCKRAKNEGFSNPVKAFAEQFVEMQKKRHAADYDPHVLMSIGAVVVDVYVVGFVIDQFSRIPDAHLRDFAIYMLFRDRPGM
jgi:hypothetical protein